MIKTLLPLRQPNITRGTAINKKAVLLLVLFLISSFIIVAKPVSAATPVENSWTSKAPMPWSNSGDKAAVANGIVYLIGVFFRYDSSTKLTIISSANYAYDPSTDTWTAIAPMPTPRMSFAIAAYDNKIYVIGGFEVTASSGLSQTSCSINEVYNPSNDTWSTEVSMPTGTGEAQANMVDGKIYVTGGMTGGPNSTVSITQIYDPTNNSWSTGAPMPYPVASAASAVVDNKIYVIGGNDEYLFSTQDPSAAYVQFNQIYNSATNTWSLGAPITSLATELTAAAATTGTAAPKLIYVFGGLIAKGNGLGGFSNQNLVYDPIENSWLIGASMPYPSVSPAVAVVDDSVYVIGGKEGVNAMGESALGNLSNEQYTPFGYGTVPPKVTVVSPIIGNYTSGNVSLSFTLNKPGSWVGYSLDAQDNVTIAGNVTLSGLSNGSHNVTVYAEDTFGNEGASETITFNVEVPTPFSTTLVVAASIAAVAVVGVGLMVYFKKRKR